MILLGIVGVSSTAEEIYPHLGDPRKNTAEYAFAAFKLWSIGHNARCERAMDQRKPKGT